MNASTAIKAGEEARKNGTKRDECPYSSRTSANAVQWWKQGWDSGGYVCPEIEEAERLADAINSVCSSVLKRLKKPCDGFEIEEGTGEYSGCTQTGGDCPVCGM